MTTMTNAPFPRVHIVGAGLLGASIGLALVERSVSVTLEDASPSALALAIDYGAGVGRESQNHEPDLVIVAVPPDVAPAVVLHALEKFESALVIDVTSVKVAVYEAVGASGVDMARFVGTHPMAGRERGGAVSARSDLFTARPWVICEGAAAAVAALHAFVTSLGAVPTQMSSSDHDQSVALMSHTPQIVSSLMAARLSGASAEALSLAGGGVRDVTRIAASDPALWVQILSANADAVGAELLAVKSDLERVIAALLDVESPGAKSSLADVFHAGRDGVSRIPGKHGVSTKFASLIVVIDDSPGELARLLTQLGQWGVNLEDLRLEHSPGANVGFADLTVTKNVVSSVEEKLIAGGWKIAGETP